MKLQEMVAQEIERCDRVSEEKETRFRNLQQLAQDLLRQVSGASCNIRISSKDEILMVFSEGFALGEGGGFSPLSLASAGEEGTPLFRVLSRDPKELVVEAIPHRRLPSNFKS